MQCWHINIRQATFIVISVIINNVNVSQMTEASGGISSEQVSKKLQQNADVILPSECLSNAQNCIELNYPCIKCSFNSNCEYGNEITAKCEARIQHGTQCKGDTSFERKFICRYCYQTESWEHTCELKANCNSIASPRAYYIANCTVHNDVICLSKERTFNKKVRCNWTGGYRWSTALILSITLGGFGADRFYLGHWQEGIGKLFSFGGLGVWTIIDVILISLHYLGPADGSLYI